MKQIIRKEQSFDLDLAAEGKMRVYRTEYIDTAHGLRPVYREVVISNSPEQFVRAPWWKRPRPNRRKKS